MDCANARVFFCPELDDELSVPDSALLHDHLRICPKCNQEWEALLLVHQNVRALKAGIMIPDKLEDRLIGAINREARKHNVRRFPTVRVTSFAAALAAVACVCLLLFRPDQHVQDSVEVLVNETADGVESPSQKNFRRVIGFDSAEKAAATKSAGVTDSIRGVAHLKVAAFDVYQDNDGRRILRACYRDRNDHSFCVDCYQANSGLLAFKGTELTTAGRKLLLKRVGNHNVVMLSKDGVDYVYTSMLPKDRLLAMVLQRG